MGRLRTSLEKNNIHLFRMRFIKPYVNFNYSTLKSLTPYRKRKIKKFYDELKYLTAQPVYKFKPRNPKRKKKALEYAGQRNRRGYKFVLVPASKDGIKPAMDFSGEKLVIKYKTKKGTKFHKEFVPINRKKFATDYEGEKKRLLNKVKDADLMIIRNGSSQLRDSYAAAELLEKRLDKLQEKYSDTMADWFVGIDAIYGGGLAETRRAFTEINSTRRDEAKKIQAKHKKARESLYRSSLKESIDNMKARVRKEEAIDAVPLMIVGKDGRVKDMLFAKEARKYRKKRDKSRGRKK